MEGVSGQMGEGKKVLEQEQGITSGAALPEPYPGETGSL